MSPQARLTKGSRGEEVLRLHQQLAKLGFKVGKQSRTFTAATASAVRSFQRTHQFPVTGVVDARTAAAITRRANGQTARRKPAAPAAPAPLLRRGPAPGPGPAPEPASQFVVQGTVRHEHGMPLSGVVVRVFQTALRHEEQLGEATTGADGQYEISYTLEPLRRIGGPRVNVRVRAYAADANRRLLAEGQTIFSADPVITVDLTVAATTPYVTSEYERLVARLAPAIRDLDLAELDNKEVAFLAEASQIPVESVASLAVAARIARRTSVSPAIIFGLLGGVVPQNIGSIFSRRPEELKAAIRAAVQSHQLPAYVEGQIDRAVEDLQTSAIDRLLHPPEGTRSSPLGEVITRMVPSAALQATFAGAYTSHEGTIESFWEAMRGDRRFSDVQLAAQLAALTKSNAPLIDALRARNGGLTSVRELATVDEDDWFAILRDPANRAMAPPDGTPGATLDERRRNYAAIMVRMLEDAYPVAALAARIAKNPANGLHTVELLDFFDKNPDVDLGGIRIDEFVDQRARLAPRTDRAKLKAQLSALQRVYKITPRFNEITALLDAGLHSASHIARVGKTAFVDQYSSALGRARAKAIYERARHVSTLAIVLYTRHSGSINTIAPRVMAQHPAEVADIPDWEMLFGSEDLCECEECRSVCSPAAYFADLLDFVRRRGGLDALRARRPDITQLKLSCENTNVVLPYIDLVNEVLETAILTGSEPARPAEPQTETTGVTAERLAHPQHLNAEAYDNDLASAVFPLSLPFHLWTEEARAYLNHLGVSRATVMEACFTGAPDGRLRDQAIAAEILGLTDTERSILTGSAPSAIAQLWGFAPAGAPPIDWISVVGNVAEMLRRSELTYRELVELVDTRFVNPTGTIAITGGCDTRQMQVVNLDEPALHRMQRFLRLRRKLNWTTRDLDRVIYAFYSAPSASRTAFDEEFLVQLSHVVRLAGISGLAPAVIANWWSPKLDTRSYATSGLDESPSLYDQLFLNRAVGDPIGSPLALAEPARDELANTSLDLSDASSNVVGALAITENDLTLIINAEFPTASGLNLANVSKVFRVASCAKALGLQVRDFLALRTLVALDLFDPAHTERVVLFADTTRRLARGPFSIADLLYVLRAESTPGSRMARSEADITQILEDLKREMSRAESKQLRTRVVRENLAAALGLEGAVAGSLLEAWVHSPDDSTQPALATFLSGPESSARRTLIRLHKIARVIAGFRLQPDEVRWAFAKGRAQGWLDLDSLPVDPVSPGPASFSGWMRIADYVALRDTLPPGDPSLIDVFDTAIDCPPADADAGRERLVRVLSTRAGWALEDLVFLTSEMPSHHRYPDDFKDERALSRLAATFAFLRRLGMSASEVWGWSSSNVSASQALAIKQAAKAKYDNDQWLAVAKPLRDVLRERQRAALVAFLLANPARIGRERVRDSGELYEHFLLDVEMSPCMLTSRLVQAIAGVQLFVQRNVIGLEQTVELTASDVGAWDSWLKNYRLWEANRKIFLYPENWIEPALRDDKSELFQQLEKRLLQDDVTDALVESAFAEYLSGLDTLARLEIAGVFHEREADGDALLAHDVLHVFGRTRSHPHRYYYRRLIDGLTWTAWEEVDAEIEGDHLIPVVHNRRMCLFWPTFVEGAEEPTLQEDQPPAKPDRYYDIRLAWSELRHGRWTPKRTSKVTLRHDYSHPDGERDRIVFRAIIDAQTNDLLIEKHVAGGGPFWSADTATAPSPARTRRADRLEAGTAGGLRLAERRFRVSASDGSVADESTNLSAPFQPTRPADTRTSYQAFLEIENGEEHDLALPYDDGIGSGMDLQPTVEKTPGTFRIDCAPDPVPGWQFLSQGPFFFGDARRTFFVTCRHARVVDPELPPLISLRPDRMLLEAVPHLHDVYAERLFGPVVARAVPAVIPATTAQPVVASPAPLGVALAPLAVAGAMAPAVAAGLGGMDVVGAAAIADRGKIGRFPRAYLAPRYRFETFYHPHVKTFRREFNRTGIDGVLRRDLQMRPEDFLVPPESAFEFTAVYRPYEQPHEIVDHPYPGETVDFRQGSAYGLYNWELFFHVPFLIATRLSQNRQFAEAQRWFHYIFDPTDASGEGMPQRYWRTKPLFELAAGEAIETLATLLNAAGNGSNTQELQQLNAQIAASYANAFKPDAVARLRPTAYQKAIVMRYIDNLIAWGDDLFRRFTRESVNEAAQLYVLAAEILGRRPEIVPPHDDGIRKSFDDLVPEIDVISDAVMKLEQQLPPSSLAHGADSNGAPPLVSLLGPSLYFCIPKNDKLLGYWRTVDDRLFKIRHCMNIEGVVTQLPLFEGAIEPGLLARAAAAGVRLEDALAPDASIASPYRFVTLIQKAKELCGELKALGGALLAALEKRDAETLGLLRSTHEIAVLNATRLVREQQVSEAQTGLDGLRKTRAATQARQLYYATRPYLNEKERAHLMLSQVAFALQQKSQPLEMTSSALAMLPQFDVGSSGPFGTPVVKAAVGGLQISEALQSAARALNIAAALSSHLGTMASIVGGYDRRMDDWRFQADQARIELQQVEKQIIGAEIRLAIAKQELSNHDLQVENATAADDFMRHKFTNRELYDWMVSQLSAVFFQSYQLTYDVAVRAQQAFRFEIGSTEASFLHPGYWDSLKKGLLAGEALSHDLNRMEMAYFSANRRELEITKHVSVAITDAKALMDLRTTGVCTLALPELLFDLDYPGHYMRRLKSVSVSIPCVTGPYTGVHCTLQLLGSAVRMNADPGAAVQDMAGTGAMIVTSGGQNDAGLFETNLRDDRYLPFEGAGAISTWQIDLPRDFNHFDFSTITDVILHVRYTAREGGSALRNAALQAIESAFPLNRYELLSLRTDFSSGWPAFARGDRTLEMALGEPGRFPAQYRGRAIAIASIEVFLRLADDAPYSTPLTVVIEPPGSAARSLVLERDMGLGGVPHAGASFADPVGIEPWTIAGLPPSIAQAGVQDVYLLVLYTVS
jgi:peptidoglycan hydrolase-like protein with peptidoglycan-binding domain